MNRPTDTPVRDWLDAEAEGRQDDADLAFRAVTQAWPAVAPPPFLAARIAHALTAVQPVPAVLGWWSRAGIAAGLAACGAVLGLLPGRALGGLLLAAFQSVAAGVGSALAAAALTWDTAHAVFQPFAWLGFALRAALSAPLPVAFLVVNVVLAAGAFAALRRVLSVREV